jgi:hypothetical protein
MLNHPFLSPSPYTYFHPSNYLSKPISLMNTPNSYSQATALSPRALYFPQDLSNNSFIPASQTNNHISYQNGTRNKLANEQISRTR